MNLLKIITAKDIAQETEISLRSAEREYKKIKKKYDVNKITWLHWLNHMNISYVDFQMIFKGK